MKQAVILVLATACIASMGLWTTLPQLYAQGAVDKTALEPRPLIDTYEIMDILMDPVYETLKDAVAIEPTRRKEWRALYLAAFTLGEQANLLFSRNDEDYMTTPEWDKLTVDMRELCNDIGEAVKAKDYPTIKTKYVALIENCNECHKRFVSEEDLTEVKAFD